MALTGGASCTGLAGAALEVEALGADGLEEGEGLEVGDLEGVEGPPTERALKESSRDRAGPPAGEDGEMGEWVCESDLEGCRAVLLQFIQGRRVGQAFQKWEETRTR